jgi:hypothetical protein
MGQVIKHLLNQKPFDPLGQIREGLNGENLACQHLEYWCKSQKK